MIPLHGEEHPAAVLHGAHGGQVMDSRCLPSKGSMIFRKDPLMEGSADRRHILFTAVTLLLLHASLPFELPDPRFRGYGVSEPVGGGGGQVLDDGRPWSVVDMHWLTMEVGRGAIQRDGYYEQGADIALRPKVGFSTVEYKVVEDECGGKGGRGHCVEIFYAVDRQSKVVLLSVPDLISDDGYLERTLRMLCDYESLSQENCRHLTSRVSDSFSQQALGVRGNLTVQATGAEPLTFPYPFPPEVILSSLPLGESTVRITLDFPGYR